MKGQDMEMTEEVMTRIAIISITERLQSKLTEMNKKELLDLERKLKKIVRR